jgi:hypothetical protein
VGEWPSAIRWSYCSEADRGLEEYLVVCRTALSLADRAYVLEVGRVVLEGRSKELLENPRIQRAYLGL